MFAAAKEKRALAMKLSFKLLYLMPLDAAPIILSKNFIRSLVLARSSPKNTLFQFAGAIIQEISDFAGKRPLNPH